MNKTNDTCEEYAYGQKIAQCGDFNRILHELKEQGLLQKSVTHMQKTYGGFFTEKEFNPGEKMWEALTILGMYDTATLEHCLRTFSITKDIATKTLLGPHGENVILKDYIEESGISLRELFLSALGHDIGKIKIPVEILHNALTDNEMNEMVIRMIGRGENVAEIGDRIGFTADELSGKSDDEIVARLYEKGIRPVNIIPLSEAFPETKYPGLLSILKERGFSENQTIKTAAKIHEAEGKKIFEELGEPVVADLVGHHHNYQKDSESELRHIMKIPLLKSHGHPAVFGVYNIIKIADTLDSMESARPYKKGLSKIAALAELAHQSETERLEKSICYLWVNSEYGEIKKTMTDSGVTDHNLLDKNSVETIERFLKKSESEFDRRNEDR